MKAKLLLIPLIFLTGCMDEGEDLQAWMANARSEAQSHVQKFEQPVPVEPVVYVAPPPIHPNAFNEARMTSALPAKGQGAPNLNRAKELLEDYELDQLRFVGVIGAGNDLSALVQAGTSNHVYTVNVGNYMGKNYGRITKITADEIILVEKVEDAEGNWTNKQARIIPSVDMDAAKAANN